MNIVVCGHIDHGKSTLIGRLLYEGKQIPDSRMSEVQKLAEEMRKKFEFAYFVDAFGDEIAQERTIETTSLRFHTDKREYVITDVPGHKEFIKNMLTGASRADASILVVAADEGIQEQTKRHLFLLNLLGIKNLIVFINKVDKSELTDINELELSLRGMVSNYSFKKVNLTLGSALTGLNIYKRHKSQPLPTLVELLDGIDEPVKDDKPLRFLVQGNYNGVTVGKVVSGEIGVWNDLYFSPSGSEGKVVNIIGEGNSIGLRLSFNRISKIPERGDVGSREFLRPARNIDAQITLISDSLKEGEEFMLKLGTRKLKAAITAFGQRLDSETGETLESKADLIKENESAKVCIRTQGDLVAEHFNYIPELGRFVIAKEKRVIGLGIVL